MTREQMIAELVRIDPNGIWTDADNVAEGNQPMTRSECVTALIGFATDEPIQNGTIVRFANPMPDENPEDLYIVTEMKGDRCDIQLGNTDMPLPPVLTVLVSDLTHA